MCAGAGGGLAQLHLGVMLVALGGDGADRHRLDRWASSRRGNRADVAAGLASDSRGNVARAIAALTAAHANTAQRADQVEVGGVAGDQQVKFALRPFLTTANQRVVGRELIKT